MHCSHLTSLAVWVGIVGVLAASQPMSLPEDPALSPDGKTLVFAWHGDLWSAPAEGGTARQITSSPARDERPRFSPDGTTLAFVSDREGSPQVFLVPERGGVPQPLTFHSEGCELESWTPDGNSLLVTARRDHFWRHAERMLLIAAKPRPLEKLILDDYGRDASLSPDGKSVLFTREGVAWWRKGYRGSQASQIWKYSLETKSLTQLCSHPSGARSPMWHPDGQQFYYVGGQSGSFNLWLRHAATGAERQITHFDDDSVLMPCISRDGTRIVFRHGFDFYRIDTRGDSKPDRIRLACRVDGIRPPTQRVTLSTATDVAFSSDGLEIAFVAGGDLWVMDTVLREPRQITKTAEEERDPAFAPDQSSILFASDAGGKTDLWAATRRDPARYWWQNPSFDLKRLTDDADQESSLKWSPDGRLVAFVKRQGDIWVMEPTGSQARQVVGLWNKPDFAWSPDGRWIAYAANDNDFNRDVFVVPIDKSSEPFNISRHPDDDSNPAWSPDGKIIAFTGRRIGTETDIYFVYLRKAEDEVGSRDRKLEEAIEKIRKGRKDAKERTSPQGKDGTAPSGTSAPAAKDEGESKKPPADKPETEKKRDEPERASPVGIDFEDIDKRIRRVSILDATEADLFWSPDSKKLGFAATIAGKRGTYTISPPDDLSPKLLSTDVGSQARWISSGNQILWLANGVPGTLSADGRATSYSFSVREEIDLAKKFEAAFDLCWRTMRDTYYDGSMNHRDWDAIRRKYASQARDAVDREAFASIVNMMLGELNGSHLGFSTGFAAGGAGSSDRTSWREVTAHLGVRWDRDHPGPGLKIKDVIHRGPADKTLSRLSANEIILRIDEKDVGPETELTAILNGPLDRDIRLRVRGTDGKERDVVLRPISYSTARDLLYDQWVRDNQRTVGSLSQNRLGYVHIAGMNMGSFYEFERDLFAVAAGKDGLIIDVRENGGGSTTDHLLTVLTQPEHAIVVSRGAGPGYPQDRRVYATWNKPIVVLCNQNSFSNAEIFSHAIKTLKRGRLVGVPTAGGVLTVGGARIMDLGFLRTPFRGWFVLNDGQDMELNGAVPDSIIWPQPGDMPAGRDAQLAKAAQLLQEDVEAWKKRPRPELIKASDRKRTP